MLHFRIIENLTTHQYHVEKLVSSGKKFIIFGQPQLEWEPVLDEPEAIEAPPYTLKNRLLFQPFPPALRKRKRVFDTVKEAITYINWKEAN